MTLYLTGNGIDSRVGGPEPGRSTLYLSTSVLKYNL